MRTKQSQNLPNTKVQVKKLLRERKSILVQKIPRPLYKLPKSIRKFFTAHGWYDGKVSTQESDGSEPITYRIDYDDNDVEDGITKRQLNAILKKG